ncbi:MAG TPA: transcription elongation factor GreB, partial [Myxococcota bacterium]|nr:transcription elongation factor GreB [Myxococcota bacterium]
MVARVTAAKRYITPEGYERLRAELERLWREERPRVTREVAEAAAHGDRSENAEYIYGKKRLREIDRRIELLGKRLDELTVVPPRDDRPDRVYFGAWVDLEDEDGAVSKYRVVGPDEFDGEKNFISMDSPIGRALMKKREGDVVHVERPIGDVELENVAIR